MNLRDIHQSKTVRGIIIGLGIAVILLGIFKLGTIAGYHKAEFSGRFGDNFHRNFVDPRGGFFQNTLETSPPPGGHGAVGEVVSIALPLIVVAGPDNLEKTVMIGEDTLIRQFRDNAAQSNIEVGNFIVVLGNPNEEGQIEAKLIRIVPPPPDFPNNK